MANNLESIEIFPGENGGHRVVHNFKREAGKKEGSMGGSVYMERAVLRQGPGGRCPAARGGALNLPLNAGNNKVDAGY